MGVPVITESSGGTIPVEQYKLAAIKGEIKFKVTTSYYRQLIKPIDMDHLSICLSVHLSVCYCTSSCRSNYYKESGVPFDSEIGLCLYIRSIKKWNDHNNRENDPLNSEASGNPEDA